MLYYVEETAGIGAADCYFKPQPAKQNPVYVVEVMIWLFNVALFW